MHPGKKESISAVAPPRIVVVAASRSRRAAALEVAEDLASGDVAARHRIGLSMPEGGVASLASLVVVGDPLDADVDPALLADIERCESAAVPVLRLRPGGGGAFLDLDMPRPARAAAALCLIASLGETRRRLAEARARESCAVERLRRHEFDLQEAAALQREFLPRRLDLGDRAACSVLWRPSRHVGGDVYDVVRLDRRHVGVLLADAVGHGIAAAILAMGLLRRVTLRSADGAALGPAEVLGHLNGALRRRSEESTWFATAAYALLDLESGLVRIASAGHPPLLRIAADGTTERIEATGGLLGIFERERYGERTIELREGDRLLMHTDGVETLLGATDSDEGNAYVDHLGALAATTRQGGLFGELLSRLEAPRQVGDAADDVTVIDLAFGPVPVDRGRREPEVPEPTARHAA